MENINPAPAKNPRVKKGAKAAATVLVGLGLLAAPGTLAGWSDSKAISDATIQSGELALDATSIGWDLNGTPVAEEDLDTLRLSPGDQLSYSGTADVTLEGTNLAAQLSMTEAATSGDLASSPVVDIDWSIDGSTDPLTLTEANDGSSYAVSWSLALAPAGDPAYQTGKEAQLQTLDLSGVEIQLVQVPKA